MTGTPSAADRWRSRAVTGPVLKAEALAALCRIAAGLAAAMMAVTASVAGETNFDFTLDAARTTSAGLYDAQGRLVRTLWRNEPLEAGTYRRSWDQRDDAGGLVAPGTYSVQVLHHNVRYVWDGVVGNTSARPGATNLHKAFKGPLSLASSAGQVHYVGGYNEGQAVVHGFDPSVPQKNTHSGIEWVDPYVSVTMVASDGQSLFWYNGGGLGSATFVGAHDLSSGRMRPFASGVQQCLAPRSDGSCYEPQFYPSVIEYRPDAFSPATGLAVQRRGPVLAVAYGIDGEVRLLDKSTGALLNTLRVPLNGVTYNQIAMAPNGDLWVISGGSALRYTDIASAPVIAAQVSGLAAPLAITVDPDDDDAVWIADGGASQQLKRYDRHGVISTTIGEPGGPNENARIHARRLCFSPLPSQEITALTVDDTHRVWVVDSCTNRILSFSPAGIPGPSIAFVPASYVSTVDSGDPSRVFANFLEYRVNYARPLSEWTLVRNWQAALLPGLRDDSALNQGYGGFRTVLTLPNGRTVAMLPNAQGSSTLVELLADGTMLKSSALPKPPRASGASQVRTPLVLYEDGDLGYSTTSEGRQTVYRLRVKPPPRSQKPQRAGEAEAGAASSHSPALQWSAKPEALASILLEEADPGYVPGTPTGALPPRFPVLGDKVIFFNGSVAAPSRYHLGAIALRGNTWHWKASPSGPLDDLGSFQTQAEDPGIQYGGNTVMVSRNSIVFGYHGEFYRDLENQQVGQANQFMHFWRNGLFVGQFGVPTTRPTPGLALQPGMAGNASSPTLVRAGRRTFLYHNDESVWGGVHRWELVGVDDIRVLSGAGELDSTITLR